MDILHADFESYFDPKTKYSLKHLPIINYVRDPRWKTLGCAVAMNDGPIRYITDEDELIAYFKAIDWSKTAFAAFNCMFDGTVLTERYGHKPAKYICTLAACRALLPIDSFSLKRVAPLLGLKEKLDALVAGATTNTKGMDEYACRDCELHLDIYNMLYPMLPEDEQELISLHIRQAAEPTLVLDEEVLVQVRDDAFAAREAAIKNSGVSESVLNSNPQFAKLLRSMGLTPPTKLSDATGDETEAFSNGDDEWVEFKLAYPEFNHIWEGRKAAKSNINIRRAEKFLTIAQSGPSHTTPMPLHYCGAHTGRSSGADGLNVQNLPNKYKSNMRKAFTAPKGYKLVVVDSAQIELRVNMWQSGQVDKLDLLRNGGDIYKAEAASQFDIEIDEVSSNQRQYGKVCQLALGFGMGAKKFQKNAAAGPLGMEPIFLTLDECYDTVMRYREGNPKIPALWRLLDQRIHQMTLPNLREEQGVLTFVHEGIELPSGRMLQYPGLMQTEDGQWVYGIDKKSHFIWGGTLCENLTQALARDIVFKQMLEINKKYRVVSSTHDEVLYLARDAEAEDALAYGLEVMSQSPSWAPDLSVSAEGAFDQYYCK